MDTFSYHFSVERVGRKDKSQDVNMSLVIAEDIHKDFNINIYITLLC